LIPRELKDSDMCKLYDPRVWHVVADFTDGTIKHADCEIDYFAVEAKNPFFTVLRIEHVAYCDRKTREKLQSREIYESVFFPLYKTVFHHMSPALGHRFYTPTFFFQTEEGAREKKVSLFKADRCFSHCYFKKAIGQLVPNMEKPVWNDVILANALRGQHVGAWLKAFEKIEIKEEE